MSCPVHLADKLRCKLLEVGFHTVATAKETTKIINHLADLNSTNIGRVGLLCFPWRNPRKALSIVAIIIAGTQQATLKAINCRNKVGLY